MDPLTSVQVEYFSSLFQFDRIPSIYTLPATLAWSKKNRRLLGFPGHLSVRSYRKEPYDCQLYLDNLWRVGKLYVLSADAKGISVNFQSDVGDISARLKQDNLRELDLGTDEQVSEVREIYPASNYALFPLHNPGFLKEGASYLAYLNYYDGEFKTGYLRVPFPYLVHVLRRVLAHYGYRITGPWIEAEETRRLVIYNTQSLAEGDQVQHSLHVPEMKVADFLKAIRAAFGLGFNFNTTKKELEIVRLRDVLSSGTYVDWRKRNLKVTKWEAKARQGFMLELSPDEGDELPPADSQQLQVGAGQDPISLGLGSLPVAQELLRWLMPQASQEGDTGKFSLRLLSYRGLQPDTGDVPYPQALPVLLPDLYEQSHRHWLDFLLETETVEAEIELSLTDLRTLRQDRKVLVHDGQSTVMALWEKISVQVSPLRGVQVAKVTLLKTRY